MRHIVIRPSLGIWACCDREVFLVERKIVERNFSFLKLAARLERNVSRSFVIYASQAQRGNLACSRCYSRIGIKRCLLLTMKRRISVAKMLLSSGNRLACSLTDYVYIILPVERRHHRDIDLSWSISTHVAASRNDSAISGISSYSAMSGEAYLFLSARGVASIFMTTARYAGDSTAAASLSLASFVHFSFSPIDRSREVTLFMT